VPKAAIARRVGIARNTVINAVASDSPPKYNADRHRRRSRRSRRGPGPERGKHFANLRSLGPGGAQTNPGFSDRTSRTGDLSTALESSCASLSSPSSPPSAPTELV
jgi:hypothetical protein